MIKIKDIENNKDNHMHKKIDTSNTLLSIEIEENSYQNINSFSKSQELREMIDFNINEFESKKVLEKHNSNPYSYSNYINNQIDDDDSSEEIDVKATLIEFVNEEKEILTKTLSGFIFYHSIKIDAVNLEYLSNLVAPLIGNFVNSKKKRYKVTNFILFLSYFYIIFI